MANDWITQKLISKTTSSAAIYDNRTAYGFGWWFAYFWKEVGARNRNEETLKAVLATVFANKFPANIATLSYKDQRTHGERVADEFTQLLPEPGDLMVNAGHYREMLTNLLNIGFREMHTAPKDLRERRDALHSMFADLIEAHKSERLVPLALAYRGETRDFQTVIQHHGALSRADLGLLNMNQPWHPFSDPVVANKTYARGASGDNCLYTVLSIASDLSIPVGFPLIEDRNIYNLSALPATVARKDLSQWNYKLYRDAQPIGDEEKKPVLLARCAISGVVDKSSGIFLATDSYIYAVKLRKAVHTQEFVEREFSMPQNQCKERGVRGVRLKNFLAGARVRRIHLGPARMCGVIGFVQEVKYLDNGAWVAQPKLSTFADYHFYGDTAAAWRALEMIRTRFGDSAGGHRIIGETSGGMAPRPLPEISSIEQWNLTFEQFKGQRDNQGDKLYYGLTS